MLSKPRIRLVALLSLAVVTACTSSSPSQGGDGVDAGSSSSGGSGGTSGGASGGTTTSSGGSSGGSSSGSSGSGTRADGSTADATGTDGASGSDGALAPVALPGDVVTSAGVAIAAAHAFTRALFAAYSGPLFQVLRSSDMTTKDIGVVAPGGLVNVATLNYFCSGATCQVTTLYDQSGNANDLWRADGTTNQPCDVGRSQCVCQLMDVDTWQMSDGTKIPMAAKTSNSLRCLRNRDKTKKVPTGSAPQTEYMVAHGGKYVNGDSTESGCCFDYGNTTTRVAGGPNGAMSALTFTKMTDWGTGIGSGPWPMMDFQNGAYAGNNVKCGRSGEPASAPCDQIGMNPNPTVAFDIVTVIGKHDGTTHWQLKSGNAKAGSLVVNVDQPLPPGYSPMAQQGGLSLGEGGGGDPGGYGAFSEGMVITGETTDATDDAIQRSIVSVYGK